MTSNRIDSAVRQQFGKQAAYYVHSQVHMSGDTLDILVDWAQPRATDRALDVATGVGFTGLRLRAPRRPGGGLRPHP